MAQLVEGEPHHAAADAGSLPIRHYRNRFELAGRRITAVHDERDPEGLAVASPEYEQIAALIVRLHLGVRVVCGAEQRQEGIAACARGNPLETCRHGRACTRDRARDHPARGPPQGSA